jgi:AraC-like DNA-binding protein/mannose-6-phosphate isomerase-like protein (cupin superfamily)
MSQTRQSAPLVEVKTDRPLVGHSSDHPAGFLIALHQHPFAQLIYAAAGVMTVATEDGIWVVPPERAVWVPPFVGHSIRMTGNVQLRTLYLEPSIAPIEGRQCCVVQVSDLLRASILRAVEFEQPYPISGAEARVVSVIVDEIHEAPTAPLHLPMPHDPRARRVADALRSEPGDTRRLAEWGRIAGASERTLERLFRNEVAMSVGAWRQQARLLHGLELLAAGESVTSVAMRLGFESPSAFIAMFRRAMGTTPGRYFRAADSP